MARRGVGATVDAQDAGGCGAGGQREPLSAGERIGKAVGVPFGRIGGPGELAVGVAGRTGRLLERVRGFVGDEVWPTRVPGS